MGVRDKRGGELSPALFKFGVALAVSIGGVVYTFLRSKRIMPFNPKPPLPPTGKRSKGDSRPENGEVGGCNRALPNSVGDLSSSNRGVVDRGGLLLPELDLLIKEYDVESPNEYKYAEHEECNREISTLRYRVKLLEEREKVLENQLLEYYGLKEQETAVMELQNRLRVHNMELKLYSCRVESLQSENKKLQAKVADYEKVVKELESAEAMIKLLRKKLRFEAEQNREQILKLQERVMKLQDQEKKPVGIDQDGEMELKETKGLEEELEEMKKYNQRLEIENSEFVKKIENLQTRAASALDDDEAQALKEESGRLRQENEDLRKEIEQLQSDRCSEIEELVYLRWINACLRYELRNYQPSPDETIARDLSRTLSPKSEEKAKKLILAYAGKEGSRDKGIDISDLDSDQWSCYFGDSGEPDDLPNENMKANKKRVFAKLMNLLKGKDNHHHIQARRERASSVDDVVSRYSSTSHSDNQHHVQTTRTSFGDSSSHSFDLRLKSTRGSSDFSRRASEDGTLGTFRTFDSITGYGDNNEAESAAKNELVKYAEALRISRANPLVRRRSAAFGSF